MKNTVNLVNLILIIAIFVIVVLTLQKWVQNNKQTIPLNPPLIQEPLMPPTPQKLDVAAAKNTITEDECKEILSWLAHDDREGRMSGKRGNVVSADYLVKEFESYGLEVSRQKFNIRRMNPGPNNEQGDDFTENIIGVLKGKSPRKIIIGGHMDHIGWGPGMSRSSSRKLEIHNGADDNASGTTAVVELAEAFSQMDQLNHTLVFICFSAEEMGLIGSRHYVSELSAEDRKNIDLMVNFDMIGWLKGQKEITVSGIARIPQLVKIVNELDDHYDFQVKPGGSGSGGSDHAPFGNANIPYAFFHTGLHDYYHTPEDDVQRIDFKGITDVAKFAFEMIVLFDEKDLIRVKEVEYPDLNETIHDHGHPEVDFPDHNHSHDHYSNSEVLELPEINYEYLEGSSK